MGKLNLIMLLCFATVIPESKKLTLGRGGGARAIEGTGRVPTSRDVSSLVVDRLRAGNEEKCRRGMC